MSEEQAGYKNDSTPSLQIEKPHNVLSISEDGLVDYKVWGWVKMSARFRSHLKRLKGAKCLVWLCIALSIDENGEFSTTIKEIQEYTDYSHTEILSSIAELEAMGYLSVNRDGRKNLYLPNFVARGENNPSESLVKKLESTPQYQVESTLSEENTRSSYKELKELSTQKSKKDQNITGIEAAIWQGRPVTDADIDPQKLERAALIAFEASFGVDTNKGQMLGWYTHKPKWTALRRNVVELYTTDSLCFEKYKAWSLTPFTSGAVKLTHIQRDPDCFMASWYTFQQTQVKQGNSPAVVSSNGATISY